MTTHYDMDWKYVYNQSLKCFYVQEMTTAVLRMTITRSQSCISENMVDRGVYELRHPQISKKAFDCVKSQRN